MNRFPTGFVITSMGHTISYEVARRLVSSYAKPIKQRRRVGTMMKKKVAAEQRWIVDCVVTYWITHTRWIT